MPGAKYFYQDPEAPTPNQPIHIGVVALIERSGELLLDRRLDGGWGLIGGAVEMHESLGEALCREVHEETGLTATGYTLFGTFSDPSRIIQYPSGDVRRILTLTYRVEIADFRVLRSSAESTALAFFAPGELQHLPIVETHRPIVDRYLTVHPIVLD